VEKDLVEYIVKSLVDVPDEVSINVVEGEKSTILELKVASEDVRQGDRQARPHCKGYQDNPECLSHQERQACRARNTGLTYGRVALDCYRKKPVWDYR